MSVNFALLFAKVSYGFITFIISSTYKVNNHCHNNWHFAVLLEAKTTLAIDFMEVS